MVESYKDPKFSPPADLEFFESLACVKRFSKILQD